MEATVLFGTLFAFCIVWYLVTSALIIGALQQRKMKINFFLIQMLLPSYVGKYRKLTREETGKTGILFYHWIISINAALIFAVVVILFKNGILQ